MLSDQRGDCSALIFPTKKKTPTLDRHLFLPTSLHPHPQPHIAGRRGGGRISSGSLPAFPSVTDHSRGSPVTGGAQCTPTTSSKSPTLSTGPSAAWRTAAPQAVGADRVAAATHTFTHLGIPPPPGWRTIFRRFCPSFGPRKAPGRSFSRLKVCQNLAKVPLLALFRHKIVQNYPKSSAQSARGNILYIAFFGGDSQVTLRLFF